MVSLSRAIMTGLLMCAAIGSVSAEETPKRPKKAPPDTARLERRLAKLEAQADRLTKEIQSLREEIRTRFSGEEKGEMQIFYLKFAKAEDMASVLRQVFATRKVEEEIQVTADVRLNSLIVRGSKARLEMVAPVVEQLDRAEGAAEPAPVRSVPIPRSREK